MNLLPEHTAKITELSPAEQKFINARFGSESIKQLPMNNALKEIKNLIIKAIARLGQYNAGKESEEKTILFITTNAYQDIVGKWINLTLQEFDIILMNLTRGDYRRREDEIICISNISIAEGIKKYMASEERRLAFNSFNLLLTKPEKKPDPSPQEQRMIILNGIKKSYIDYLDTNTLPAYSKMYYQKLKGIHKIEWTDDETVAIETIAMERALANVNEILPKERSWIITNIKNKTHPSFINECCKLALGMFYDRMKKEGVADILTLNK